MYGCVFHKEDGFCEKFSDDRCKSYCVMGPCQYAIPSNADRIRGMSDEGLAEWLSCNSTGDGYGNGTEEWLSWLKSPVEAEDGT